jgi:hypothetical protein
MVRILNLKLCVCVAEAQAVDSVITLLPLDRMYFQFHVNRDSLHAMMGLRIMNALTT